MTRCVLNMQRSFLSVQLEKSLVCSSGARSRLDSSAVQRSELKPGKAHADAGQELPKGVSSDGAYLSIRDIWKSL